MRTFVCLSVLLGGVFLSGSLEAYPGYGCAAGVYHGCGPYAYSGPRVVRRYKTTVVHPAGAYYGCPVQRPHVYNRGYGYHEGYTCHTRRSCYPHCDYGSAYPY